MPRWSSLFGIRASDPAGELVDVSGLSGADLEQIDELMAALMQLRMTEQRLSDAARQEMDINTTDMRAVHLLISCENRGELATASTVARTLDISSASTTKLLDRLEHKGHIRREPHPTDRRSLVISLESGTRTLAMRTVGEVQARRVHAARRLSPEHRDVVTAFLRDMTAQIAGESDPAAE